MRYNFDEVIDRRGTNSIKYDFFVEKGKQEGALSLWVADMDFQTAPGVTEALTRAVAHGIYGYTEVKEEYFNTVAGWFRQRFHWRVEKEWLVKTPGVVYAIACAIRALTKEGDGVLIQKPVYYPFSETIRANNRRLINSPLIYKDGTYYMDLEDVEAKIIDHKVKLFILCSPHNPVGRIWTKEELTQIGDICLRHGVIVVSDEIHGDFNYPGYSHQIFADIKPEFLQNSILCTAPSKTFNLAGLQVSNIFIANQEIRRKIIHEIRAGGYSQLNTLGLIACRAAYEEGAQWLDELKEYLLGNLNYIRSFLQEKLPEIRLVEPQGTYLVWLDFKSLGLEDQELENLINNKARLWLDGGTMFGEEGSGFQRVNIACPRSVIKQAMEQLAEGVRSIK